MEVGEKRRIQIKKDGSSKNSFQYASTFVYKQTKRPTNKKTKKQKSKKQQRKRRETKKTRSLADLSVGQAEHLVRLLIQDNFEDNALVSNERYHDLSYTSLTENVFE